ncbi:MAG: hypothetical protein HQK73_03460, partial [Desulfamplus sp.]|nr:hypothetical protein [Desulfamplus sp.]
MANGSISLKGVDKAIASLNYKDSSVKKRAVLAIREYYSSDDAVSQLKSINTDELTKIIWDIGDDVSKIKSKKRNFYSIISSINSDLANLSPETENPEKLTITSENIFDMTEDAKNSLLNSFSEVARNANLDLNQITDVLKSITEMISKMEIEAGAENTKFSDTLEQIKNRLLSISDSVLEEQVQDGDEIIEEISKDDVVEEVEEIEDVEDIEELDEDVEVIDAD